MLYIILIAVVVSAVFFAVATMLYFVGVALYALGKGFMDEWKRSTRESHTS